MIAVKPTQLREQLKTICDQVVKGETVIICRPNHENVVMVSEKQYNEMMRVVRNAAYLEMIDESMAALEKGGLLPKSAKK